MKNNRKLVAKNALRKLRASKTFLSFENLKTREFFLIFESDQCHLFIGIRRDLIIIKTRLIGQEIASKNSEITETNITIKS